MARRIDPKVYLQNQIISLARETGLGPPDPKEIEVRHGQSAWWRGQNSVGEQVTLRASYKWGAKDGTSRKVSGLGIRRLVGTTEVNLAVLREQIVHPGGRQRSAFLRLTHDLPFDVQKGVLRCQASYGASSVGPVEDWFGRFSAQWNSVRTGEKGVQFSLEHLTRKRGLVPSPRTMLFMPAVRADSLEFLLRQEGFRQFFGRAGIILRAPCGSRLPWQVAQGLLTGLQMALEIGVRLPQSSGAPTIRTLREFVEIAMLVA